MIDARRIKFCGGSLEDLREFPLLARRDAGHQLDQVQRGRIDLRLAADEGRFIGADADLGERVRYRELAAKL